MMTSRVMGCSQLKNFVLMCFVLLLSLGCLLDNVQALQRYCGNNLVQAMSLLCPHGYKHKLRKRIGNDFDYDTLANDILTLDTSDYSQPSSDSSNADDSSEAQPFASSPFLSSVYNGMMLTEAHRRQRRRSIGAYDECCLKGCSVAEMTAYCHVP